MVVRDEKSGGYLNTAPSGSKVRPNNLEATNLGADIPGFSLSGRTKVMDPLKIL